jgi:hypothetical protein
MGNKRFLRQWQVKFFVKEVTRYDLYRKMVRIDFQGKPGGLGCAGINGENAFS